MGLFHGTERNDKTILAIPLSSENYQIPKSFPIFALFPATENVGDHRAPTSLGLGSQAPVISPCSFVSFVVNGFPISAIFGNFGISGNGPIAFIRSKVVLFFPDHPITHDHQITRSSLRASVSP
jgi:hypothetical protein